jgi:hypothetical protein
MQLEVKFQEIKPVESNFEDLKVELKEQLEKYENLVVIEADLPKYKTDRANLNKLKTALNNERIRVKNEFTAPIKLFEGQVNDLIKMVDNPINCLDSQLKKFEEKRREEKREAIDAAFNEMNDIDQVKLNQVFDESWLNVSVSMKKIKESITAYIDKIHSEIQAITNLDSEIEDDLQALYLKRFNLAEVIAKKNEYDAMKARAEAKKKEREALEAKRKEEAEKLEKERIEREAKRKLDEMNERIAQKEAELIQIQQQQAQKQVQAPIQHVVPDPVIETPVTETNEFETELLEIDFRVWVTRAQKVQLRNFFIENNIKYGSVK